MERLARIYTIALVLSESQLRASRSGRGGESFFRRASILAIVDAVCFVVFAGIGFVVVGGILALPASQAAPLVRDVVDLLVIVPALVPSAVLVAGVLFELSSSTKFGSSDAINWLPVTKGEYVTASTLSVAYAYSVVPSVMMGATLWPAVRLGYTGTWVEMLFLSCVSLVYGGAIVEIIRAAINRVTTVIMTRARRGALVLRLAATIGVILLLEATFNFVILIDLVGGFTSALGRVEYLPVLWASVAVRASEAGDVFQSAIFSAATVVFAAAVLWVAVKVRSRYWSPTPSMATVAPSEYAPSSGVPTAFALFGLNESEAALVVKDLRGFTRRRELLQYLAIPFVLAIVFVFEIFVTPASAAEGAVTYQLPVWFVGGLFGLLVSSISFGQEGRAAPLLGSLPLTPREVLRAKVFGSLLLAMIATVGMFVVVTAISRPPPAAVAENFVVAVAITAQEVCLGTAFGVRYADFQERPRPRFVDPYGILLMMIVGITLLFVTASPSLLTAALVSFPALQSKVQPLYLASVLFAATVALLSYRWASGQAARLLAEFSQ